MNKTINNYIKELNYDYSNKKVVDFSKFLTKHDLEILRNFHIFIENRLYTQEEFFLIKMQVFIYLDLNNLPKNDFDRLHSSFLSIINNYNF